MAATNFSVYVAIDDETLRSKVAWTVDRREILASFEAALDHWIAEQRLELRHR